MSDLNRSKRYDIIHVDISKIHLDISTIFSPSITPNLRNIFLIYIQLNFSWIRQICQTKILFFWDLNIKVICTDIHTSVHDKRDALVFLLLISYGWVVTFQDYHHTVFTFCSWLELLGVVLAFRKSQNNIKTADKGL